MDPSESPAISPPGETYATCENCTAPVDGAQRYCVVCGTRRRNVADPAAQFMSAATSRARIGARRQATASRAGGARRGAGLGTAIVIALIPLGVGLGVLIGRGANSGDGKLLAALKAQKPENVYVGGSAASANTTRATPSIHTGFPLSSGYTIELSTLPAGTTQSAASRTEAAAKAKGATGVGIVSVSDYSLTPKPAGAEFVVYAGDFTTRATATRSLSKLKHAFPGALVIAVKSSASNAGAGKVVSTTRYGSATQATGYKPSAASLAQGASVAGSVSKKIGKSYVVAQKGLPSVVSVP